MKRCKLMVDVGRRQFLSGASMAAAGVAAATVGVPQGKAASAARVSYPSNRLANVSELKANEPLNVSYPDNDAPGVLLKLGKRVADGVGPDGDIVGFSTTCPHKGFPLSYNKSDRTLNCPGHYSRFDCEAGGQQIWGQATQNLPQYVLRVDAKGDIYAEGVDELLYGRLSNVLGGGKNGLQTANRSASNHPQGCEGVQRHLPLLHRGLRLQGLHLAHQQTGWHGT
jgi:arsenite oxidase small subunit